MRWGALFRAAALAGITNALIVAGAGRLLTWTFAVGDLFLAGSLIGAVVALICAAAFEGGVAWSGARAGALVGLLVGMTGGALTGLLPWLAAYYDLIYLPAASPLGPHDPSWPLAVIVGAATVAGGIAGASYGTPRRVLRTPAQIEFREIFRRG